MSTVQRFISFGFLLFWSTLSVAVSLPYPSVIDGPDSNYVYVGLHLAHANLSYSQKWLQDHTIYSSAETVDHTGLAGHFNVGYRFTRHIAAEVGYTYFSEVTFRNLNHIQGTAADFTQETVDGFVKFILPASRCVDLYGKAGLAWVYREPIAKSPSFDHSLVVPAVSGGVNYRFGRHMGLEAAYYAYFHSQSVETTQFVTLGLIYEFN